MCCGYTVIHVVCIVGDTVMHVVYIVGYSYTCRMYSVGYSYRCSMHCGDKVIHIKMDNNNIHQFMWTSTRKSALLNTHSLAVTFVDVT